MEELWAYRERLLARHAEQVAVLRRILDRLPIGRMSAPGPDGGWSAHQVAVHVRDSEIQAYIPRVHRMLAEDCPLLPDFDAGTFMAEHYDPAEAVAQIVGDIERARQGVRSALRFDDGQAWSRTGRHPALGTCTVQTWVERAVGHVDEHLHQLEAVRRAGGRSRGARKGGSP